MKVSKYASKSDEFTERQSQAKQLKVHRQKYARKSDEFTERHSEAKQLKFVAETHTSIHTLCHGVSAYVPVIA